MIVQRFNLDNIEWVNEFGDDAVRVVTSRGTFEISDKAGVVKIRAPDGGIRCAPVASNVLEMDVYNQINGKPF